MSTHLEIAIVHTPKRVVLPQLLRRDPRARNAKRDPGQEPRVVADSGSGQDALDPRLIDAPLPRRVVTRGQELDPSLLQAEIAVTATSLGDGAVVGEVARQFAAEAAFGGDEVDDAPDAVHVALLPRFDLRVDGRDDLRLVLFAPGEVFEDAEAVHHAARLQFDGAGVVPFLQLLHRFRAGEAPARGGVVDVDARPFVGERAFLLEGFGDG